MITFGSLFSGIGGLDLGLERAGMSCKWQVEIDGYATRVLERHWPNVKRWRDIADFIADANQSQQRKQPCGRSLGRMGRESKQHQTYEPLGCDLVCGGFPCQPVSLAGRRQGQSDQRWLWNSFRQVISILRPRFVLAENVPGLLSAENAMGRRGALFGGILRDLARMGYDAEWGRIPAAAFGAPHLRYRLFIIGYSHQTRFQERTRQPEDNGQQFAPPIGTDWRNITPTLRRGHPRVSHRLDRLKCLGNAVVPQVAQWLGEQIITRC